MGIFDQLRKSNVFSVEVNGETFYLRIVDCEAHDLFWERVRAKHPNQMGFLLLHTLCDHNGKLLLTPDDEAELNHVNADTFAKLSDFAIQHCLPDAVLNELKKNSERAPQGSSDSGLLPTIDKPISNSPPDGPA